MQLASDMKTNAMIAAGRPGMSTTALRPKAPPIKTQGIKTKLVPFITRHVAWDWNGIWIEPFLGSGAVLLNIQPPRAFVSDSCVHIINFYRALQSGDITAARVEAFLAAEGEALKAGGESHYYALRDRFNDNGSPLDFLFLSRSCFNGLIRFNQKGGFNTPFCRKPERFSKTYITKICNQVKWARNVIGGKEWEFVYSDWKPILSQATESDFIYADPPYAGRYADYYNQWKDEDAAQLAHTLSQAPCRFLLSSWVQNPFRRNDSLFDWFSGYQIATFSHYYHLGATEELRHEMQEGLVIG